MRQNRNSPEQHRLFEETIRAGGYRMSEDVFDQILRRLARSPVRRAVQAPQAKRQDTTKEKVGA